MSTIIPFKELVAWHRADLARQGGLSVVPIWQTMRRAREAGFEAGDLLDTLRGLHAEGLLVELVPHSRTHGLTEEEEASIIRGKYGESFYYWKPRGRSPADYEKRAQLRRAGIRC